MILSFCPGFLTPLGRFSAARRIDRHRGCERVALRKKVRQSESSYPAFRGDRIPRIAVAFPGFYLSANMWITGSTKVALTQSDPRDETGKVLQHGSASLPSKVLKVHENVAHVEAAPRALTRATAEI